MSNSLPAPLYALSRYEVTQLLFALNLCRSHVTCGEPGGDTVMAAIRQAINALTVHAHADQQETPHD